MPQALQLDFAQENLVGSVNKTACHIDTTLNTPWGVAVKKHHDCVKEIAVAAYQSGSVFQFNSCGDIKASTIYVLNTAGTSGNPTGVVFNCGSGFPVGATGVTGSAQIIIAQGNAPGTGTISGFTDSVNTLYATNVVGATGIYTGVALYKKNLYATNFENGTIDVYNNNWNLIAQYQDPDLTAIGFHPYNVQVIDFRGCKRLAVTFALYNALGLPTPAFATYGTGYGFVDLFDDDGNYVRFINQGPLNAPWAVFNICVGHESFVGVGNNGDGKINFFNEHGKYVFQARNEYGSPLYLGGLFGVQPDPKKAVLYAALGIDDAAPVNSGIFAKLVAQ